MSAVEWMDPPPSRRSSDHDRGLSTFTDAAIRATKSGLVDVYARWRG